MSGELQELTARQTGRQLKKRDLTVVDESNAAISLTLWGTQAEQFDSSNAPTIAIKGARIGEYNGAKNISSISSTVLQIDPDIEEAHKLVFISNFSLSAIFIFSKKNIYISQVLNFEKLEINEINIF